MIEENAIILTKMRLKILIFGDWISMKKAHSLHVFWLHCFQVINNVMCDVTDLGLLLYTFLILTSDFVTALEWVLRKPQSRFITARKFPCWNTDFHPLKHGCIYDATLLFMQWYKILASLCSWAGWYESYLVTNPEDRFSHGLAHLK